MADYGAKFADRKIRKVDRQLQAIYRQAQKELEEKLADFVRKSAARDRYKRTQVKAGVLSEEEYQKWLRGQVFQRQAWQNRVEQVAQVMYNHDVAAAQMIHENKIDVYNENYLYSAFETEQIAGISFHLQDSATITKLIKDRDKLLPEWKIDEKKDYQWCYRKVNNAVTQGIIQGEGVDKIMKRLSRDLCAQDESKMRMFARTAVTGAQNAGRQQEMIDAEQEHGVEIHKVWRAILDNRTRDVHRKLDGQEKPCDEPFDSDLGEIMFPGDPEADAANVYNCRCGMIKVYPKYRNVVNNSVRRAYGEYVDQDGKVHRYSYLTADPEAYQRWKSDKTIPSYSRKAESANELQKTINSIREKMEEKAFMGSLPDEYKQAVLDSLNGMSKEMLELIDRTMGNVNITWMEENPAHPSSHYLDGTGRIYLLEKDGSGEFRTKEDMLRAFWHEYGHFIDDAKVSGSGYGYQSETIDYFFYGIKPEIMKDDRWQYACAKDVNLFLERAGLNDRYECRFEPGMYSAGIWKNGTWIDPRMMDYDTLSELENELVKWSKKATGYISYDDYRQNLGYPKRPERTDYYETYTTPKRNILRERETYKGAGEAYHIALQNYYREVDAFESTHDMMKILDEWEKINKEVKRREELLGSATDTFDAGSGGCFSAHILLGGHEPNYYARGHLGANEAVANAFSCQALNDKEMVEIMKDLNPNVYELIVGVINK